MSRNIDTNAVLFADITGSTALYHALGDTTARTVVEEFVRLCRGLLEPHQGRLVKTMGDAVMCVLPTADQGILAASAIQASVATTPLGGHLIRTHIGVHFGSVIGDIGDDIYGDTVNIAAYLTAMAAPEQILTSEPTYRRLSAALRGCARPIFHTRIKSSGHETTIYQILWKVDRSELTEVNLSVERTLPTDIGALLLTSGEQALHVDHQRRSVLLGRSTHCDIVTDNRFASREHALVRLDRASFFLVDQSSNGTYVELENGDTVHVLRSQILLGSRGRIWMGHRSEAEAGSPVEFSRDRRSLFRV